MVVYGIYILTSLCILIYLRYNLSSYGRDLIRRLNLSFNGRLGAFLFISWGIVVCILFDATFAFWVPLAYDTATRLLYHVPVPATHIALLVLCCVPIHISYASFTLFEGDPETRKVLDIFFHSEEEVEVPPLLI